MENNISLPANMKELLELVKSRADEDNSEEELLGLMVGSSFDSDGNICDDLINHMIEYIKTNPEAGIDEIFEHLVEIIPDAEYVDEEESA